MGPYYGYKYMVDLLGKRYLDSRGCLRQEICRDPHLGDVQAAAVREDILPYHE